ncbi:MAG TPA: YceI family protein [Rhizomicrobium sp.]|nr:YceI family protein [Rhizomicrobium sp.]
MIRLRKLALLCVVTLLPTVPALAGDATVPAASYTLDPRHSQVIFGIRHMGLSVFFGRFSKVTGTLTFDPNAPEKSALDAEIDMTAIDTHVPELDQELAGGSVFDAKQFPTAKFHATGITKTGANTGTVTGDLTLHGVTKPVTLNVVFDGGTSPPIPFSKFRIGFDATGTIKRSDFGITPAMWSSMVSDDVTLQIEAEFEKN